MKALDIQNQGCLFARCSSVDYDFNPRHNHQWVVYLFSVFNSGNLSSEL